MATEYLTAKDIAKELKVSRSRAYAIARECTRLIDGRSIRVTRASFEAWKLRRTWDPSPSLSAVVSGGARSSTRTEAGGSRSRRGASTTKPLSKSGERSSELPLDPPIQPKTKPVSEPPSPYDEQNEKLLAELRARFTC